VPTSVTPEPDEHRPFLLHLTQGVFAVKSRFVATLAIAALLMASAPAFAQQKPVHMDPATGGTTGLFLVPLASVLRPGTFSAGASYTMLAWEHGDSATETLTLFGAFSFEQAEGMEVFVSFEPRIGVDRDYHVELATGATLEEAKLLAPRLDFYPYATDTWRTGLGDLRIGAKYKAVGDIDAYDGAAVYGSIKLPTSDTDAGVGTGKVDFSVGVVASAEAADVFGVSGFVGGTFRASPDEFDIGNSLDYGIGVQVPTRFWISGIFEISGAFVQDPDNPTPLDLDTGYVTGYDPIFMIGGLRMSHESGMALDVAYTRSLKFDVPGALDPEPVGNGGGYAKLTYTNSREEPVVLMGAAPMALPPVNRPPTLSCRAERTSVRVGESVRLFADVNDPDGDATTVTWSTQAGSINPREGETVTWSSQGVRPGSGPVAARVTDGYGGTADCELTLTVEAPPPAPQPRILTFTCSEFPSGNTRIDNRCKAILDDVALQLRQNPSATAVITGHSDSAGAADVNDRMSMERADNAETYLVDTHGIVGDRIETVSAGSSQPVGDNTTAEGRLQNRRIVVVVTIPAQ
jgi:outer membrane protein OmpA-like peptidoglycan-associated protein